MHDEEEFNPDPFEAKLKWVDGACYRIYKNKMGDAIVDKTEQHQTLKPYTEFDEDEDYTMESCVNPRDSTQDLEIKQTDNGRFKTTIAVPQKFYAYIIGAKGSRKRQLEHETKTEITIPRAKHDKNICINGPTVTNVVSAKRRIELMAMDLRDKHMITHFISYPLISDEIKKNFEEFKQLILKEKECKGLDETIFQKTDKIHLTIGTLVLLDDEETEKAAEILKEMKQEIIDPYIAQTGPITLRMKGLQYMNDDPSSVDVLYAKVEVVDQETNYQIQKLSNDIVEFFSKKGIMKKEYDMVKLHATLMNTRYRREHSPAKGDGRYPKRVSFDARPILEKYKDYDFGLQPFTSIQLSDRSTVDKNGYYGCKGKIAVNNN